MPSWESPSVATIVTRALANIAPMRFSCSVRAASSPCTIHCRALIVSDDALDHERRCLGFNEEEIRSETSHHWSQLLNHTPKTTLQIIGGNEDLQGRLPRDSAHP